MSDVSTMARVASLFKCSGPVSGAEEEGYLENTRVISSPHPPNKAFERIEGGLGKRRGNKIKDGGEGMEFLCINEFLVASEKVYNGYPVRRKVKKEQNCSGRGNLLVGFTILWRNTVTWVEVKIQNEMTDGRA